MAGIAYLNWYNQPPPPARDKPARSFQASPPQMDTISGDSIQLAKSTSPEDVLINRTDILSAKGDSVFILRPIDPMIPPVPPCDIVRFDNNVQTKLDEVKLVKDDNEPKQDHAQDHNHPRTIR